MVRYIPCWHRWATSVCYEICIPHTLPLVNMTPMKRTRFGILQNLYVWKSEEDALIWHQVIFISYSYHEHWYWFRSQSSSIVRNICMHMMMYRSKLSVRSNLIWSGELRRPFKHFTRSGKGRDSRVPPSDFSIAIKDLGIQEHHITEIMILYISYVDLYLSIYLYIYIIYVHLPFWLRILCLCL